MSENAALRLACANEKWGIAHQLVRAGADANIGKELDRSVLQIDIEEGADANLIRAFVQGGARIATRSAHLGSPLHAAAKRGD